MVCISAGTSAEIKTPFNAISLFKCCHPKINSISIKDSAPLSDDVTEVTNCGNTCSVPPKRCICVGLMDNNLVSGTVHSCTSTIATAHDTAKYCKQTICKEDSLTCTSDTNGMYIHNYICSYVPYFYIIM